MGFKLNITLLIFVCYFFQIHILVASNVYNIVALGKTGVGKSSLLNMLSGSNAFEVAVGIEKKTKETVTQRKSLNIDIAYHIKDFGLKLTMVDTPGFYTGIKFEVDKFIEDIDNSYQNIMRMVK